MDKGTETFLKVMTPEDTTAGGGSASAIAGAMAAALLGMVCRLTTQSQDETEKHLVNETAIQAQEFCDQLLLGSWQDGEAFAAISRGYQMPKDSDEQREVRKQTLQAAWKHATQVPLENARRCYQVLLLGSQLQGHINPNVVSDLHCALLLAHAGALGCLENVAINLPAIKDQAAVTDLAGQASQLKGQIRAINPPQADLITD